jgi:uncharacterized protein (TIRG00374 family)
VKALKRPIVIRSALLLVAGVSLYLLAPSLLEIFSSWPQLRDLDPLWLGLAVFFEAAAYVSLWTLQRITLRTSSWFAVGTSQLAASSAGSVIPGGGAAASAVQYSLLVRAGVPGSTIARGLAATWAATTGMAFALPVIASLAAIGGAAAPEGLRRVAYIGGAAFVLLATVGVVAFGWNRPLRFAGRAVRAAAGVVHQGSRFVDLPDRLVLHRNEVRSAVAQHPVLALLAALGRWGFDFLALVCVLEALGVEARPTLVLLAYSATILLAMIPLTPGGLGFVEAGLAGLLVLAGLDAGEAGVATLAYRLIAFWLLLPCGAIAYVLARRRYGNAPVPEAPVTTSSSP